MTKSELEEIFGWTKGVLCDTKEEAIDFLTQLEQYNYKWWYGEKPDLVKDFYYENKPTIFYMSDGYFHRNLENEHMYVVLQCTDINYCLKTLTKITKWSDFMNTENKCPYCNTESSIVKLIHREDIEQNCEVEICIDDYAELSINANTDKYSDYLSANEELLINEISFDIPIKFCPMCGRNLETYQSKLQKFINNKDLINDISNFGHSYYIEFDYNNLQKVKSELENIFDIYLKFEQCVKFNSDTVEFNLIKLLEDCEIDFRKLYREDE